MQRKVIWNKIYNNTYEQSLGIHESVSSSAQPYLFSMCNCFNSIDVGRPMLLLANNLLLWSTLGGYSRQILIHLVLYLK